jgi:ligand-binding sensor domain-containing protein
MSVYSKTGYLLLGLFSLSVIELSAQSFSIQRIGIEQGLSNNYVVSITQDRQGFMWFATESGLNRFDGKEFRLYKKDFTGNGGISGNEFNKVYADTKDNLVWIATQRTGLNVFNCETDDFKLFTHDSNDEKSLRSDAVTDITNDTAGNVWLATYSNGVDYYDKKKREFIHVGAQGLGG